MKGIYLASSILFLVLWIFLCSGCSSIPADISPPPDNAIVWSDDFEDGDTEGWEESTPGEIFGVKDGVLTAEPDSAGDIGHVSNVASGTWSFDLFYVEGEETYYDFCISCDQDNNFGFGFNTLTMGNTILTFVILDNGRKSMVDAGSPVRDITGWNHFDITRDDLGNSKVYLNGELILEYKDELHFTPHWFNFHAQETGPVLDNLVVRNQVIDIQPAE